MTNKTLVFITQITTRDRITLISSKQKVEQSTSKETIPYSQPSNTIGPCPHSRRDAIGRGPIPTSLNWPRHDSRFSSGRREVSLGEKCWAFAYFGREALGSRGQTK